MEFISIEINVLWQTKWRETHCQIWLLSYLPIHVLVYNIFVYMIMESNQKKKLLLNYEKFCMKTIKTLNKTVFWIPVLLVPHPYLAFKLLFKLFLLPSLFFFNVWSWFNNLVFFFFYFLQMLKWWSTLSLWSSTRQPWHPCSTVEGMLQSAAELLWHVSSNQKEKLGRACDPVDGIDFGVCGV